MRRRYYPDDADFEAITEDRYGDPDEALGRAERTYERQFTPTAADVGADQ